MHSTRHFFDLGRQVVLKASSLLFQLEGKYLYVYQVLTQLFLQQGESPYFKQFFGKGHGVFRNKRGTGTAFDALHEMVVNLLTKLFTSRPTPEAVLSTIANLPRVFENKQGLDQLMKHIKSLQSAEVARGEYAVAPEAVPVTNFSIGDRVRVRLSGDWIQGKYAKRGDRGTVELVYKGESQIVVLRLDVPKEFGTVVNFPITSANLKRCAEDDGPEQKVSFPLSSGERERT